jgi:hypothetical protein
MMFMHSRCDYDDVAPVRWESSSAAQFLTRLPEEINFSLLLVQELNQFPLTKAVILNVKLGLQHQSALRVMQSNFWHFAATVIQAHKVLPSVSHCHLHLCRPSDVLHQMYKEGLPCMFHMHASPGER